MQKCFLDFYLGKGGDLSYRDNGDFSKRCEITALFYTCPPFTLIFSK